MGTKKLKSTTTVKPLSANMKALAASLDTLNTERVQWEVGAFKTANEGLYSLLGKCHAKYVEDYLSASAVEQSSLIEHLKSLLNAAKIKVQKNTPDLTVFVRYIFRTDRSRAYTYAKAINSAIEDGVAPDQLPNHIATAGGIQYMKRSQAALENAANTESKLVTMKGSVASRVDTSTASAKARVVLAGYKGTILLLARNVPNTQEVEILEAVDQIDNRAIDYFKTQLALQELKAQADKAKQQQANANAGIYDEAREQIQPIGQRAQTPETVGDAEAEAVLA